MSRKNRADRRQKAVSERSQRRKPTFQVKGILVKHEKERDVTRQLHPARIGRIEDGERGRRSQFRFLIGIRVGGDSPELGDERLKPARANARPARSIRRAPPPERAARSPGHVQRSRARVPGSGRTRSLGVSRPSSAMRSSSGRIAPRLRSVSSKIAGSWLVSATRSLATRLSPCKRDRYSRLAEGQDRHENKHAQPDGRVVACRRAHHSPFRRRPRRRPRVNQNIEPLEHRWQPPPLGMVTPE